MSQYSRPQPVLTAAAVAAVVEAVALVLGFLGFAAAATQLKSQALVIGSAVVAAVPFITHLVAAFHARNQVTPLAAPVAVDGTALVKTGTVTPGVTYVQPLPSPQIESRAVEVVYNQNVAALAVNPGADVDAVLAEAEAIYPSRHAIK